MNPQEYLDAYIVWIDKAYDGPLLAKKGKDCDPDLFLDFACCDTHRQLNNELLALQGQALLFPLEIDPEQVAVLSPVWWKKFGNMYNIELPQRLPFQR